MLTPSTGVIGALLAVLLGLVPAAHGHRCIRMKVQMPASHECCPDRGQAPQTELSEPCCEPTSTGVASAYTTAPRLADEILTGVDQPVGLLEPIALSRSCFSVERAAAAPFRPPGERLHELTAVLRI